MRVSRKRKNGVWQYCVHWRNPARPPARPYSRNWFPSREAAENFLAGKQSERDKLGSDWVDVAPADRVTVMAALREAQKAGVDLRQAVQDAAAARPGGRIQTVREMFAACALAREVQGLRARSIRALRGTFRRFERSGLCHLPASSITPQHIADYVAGLKVGKRTRLGELINLQTGFSFGVDAEILAKNPCAKVPRPIVPQKRTTVLTPEQAENLFCVCEREDPELLGFLSLAAFAGLRPESEVERLTRADVVARLKMGTLEPPVENKTRRRRLVPILPNLRAWLEAWAPLGAEVIPPNFQRRWRRIRKLAGIWPWPQNVLRHSRVSYRLAVTRDAAATAMEDGHSEAEMHETYKELVPDADGARYYEIMPTPGMDYRANAATARERLAEKRRGTPEHMRAMARARWTAKWISAGNESEPSKPSQP